MRVNVNAADFTGFLTVSIKLNSKTTVKNQSKICVRRLKWNSGGFYCYFENYYVCNKSIDREGRMEMKHSKRTKTKSNRFGKPTKRTFLHRKWMEIKVSFKFRFFSLYHLLFRNSNHHFLWLFPSNIPLGVHFFPLY